MDAEVDDGSFGEDGVRPDPNWRLWDLVLSNVGRAAKNFCPGGVDLQAAGTQPDHDVVDACRYLLLETR